SQQYARASICVGGRHGGWEPTWRMGSDIEASRPTWLRTWDRASLRRQGRSRPARSSKVRTHLHGRRRRAWRRGPQDGQASRWNVCRRQTVPAAPAVRTAGTSRLGQHSQGRAIDLLSGLQNEEPGIAPLPDRFAREELEPGRGALAEQRLHLAPRIEEDPPAPASPRAPKPKVARRRQGCAADHAVDED